jgi:hypothetical protein
VFRKTLGVSSHAEVDGPLFSRSDKRLAIGSVEGVKRLNMNQLADSSNGLQDKLERREI